MSHSEPPESLSQLDKPMGSVQEAAICENSLDNRTPILVPKQHGLTHDGDDAKCSLPKRARKGSEHKSLDPKKSPINTGGKSQNIWAPFISGWKDFHFCVHRILQTWPRVFMLPVNCRPSERKATSLFWLGIAQIPFSQLFRMLKRNLRALIKYQFQTMFLHCQALPTQRTPNGHVVSNLRVSKTFPSELY